MNRTDEIRLLKYAVKGARGKLRNYKQQYKRTESKYYDDKIREVRRDISIYSQRLADLRNF